MKKVLSVLVAAALVTMATSAMALTIVNTKHDLSVGVSGYSASNTTQVCVFCHTPHNATQTRALWNRNAGAVTSFSLYTSGANIENATWYIGGSKTTLPATSPSMLCLSCHDGSTTMNNISRPPAGIAPNNAVAISSGGANLGSALTNDHPISINYAAFVTGLTGTLVAQTGNNVVAASTKLLPLANGVSLECNTCHNVHDNNYKPFLRDTMDKSALCTACHIK
jgi:predicted CXXCH cytochrome family protein